ESAIMPERIGPYREQLVEMGVEMVERPEALLGRVDAVLIESQEGAAHLGRARPFLEAGVPLFIDKPFANSVHDAREIARLAGGRGGDGAMARRPDRHGARHSRRRRALWGGRVRREGGANSAARSALRLPGAAAADRGVLRDGPATDPALTHGGDRGVHGSGA